MSKLLTVKEWEEVCKRADNDLISTLRKAGNTDKEITTLITNTLNASIFGANK